MIGEYINVEDPRISRLLESWRGVRPALHYSYSRDEHLPYADQPHRGLHSRDGLLAQGFKKAKLRAHSDMYPNPDVNAWAISFWKHFDIQCEAKMKNLASQQLWEQATA